MFDLLLSVYHGNIDANLAGAVKNVRCGDLTPDPVVLANF